MPLFKIDVVNQHFSSCDEYDLPTVAIARTKAIEGALAIGVAEVGEDQPFFGAEVRVASSGEELCRFLVSIGVSPLQ